MHMHTIIIQIDILVVYEFITLWMQYAMDLDTTATTQSLSACVWGVLATLVASALVIAIHYGENK